MRAVLRLRFEPTKLAPRGTTLIDRYLDRDDHALLGEWTLPPPATGLGDIELALRDTVGSITELEPRDDAATIRHVLWVRDERAARISIGDDTWPIAPGDSVVVPASTPTRIEGRQLIVEVALPGADLPAAPPTHGEERFFGYNRQTVCIHVAGVRLCRWKLTQPLALAEHHPGPVLVLALARSSVVRTASEIHQLAQGDLALIDPAAAPIVTPDGLSYLLAIDRKPQAETA